MSKTLLEFLQAPVKKGLFYWIKFWWKNLNLSKQSKNSKNWVGLKIHHSYTPENWDVNNPYGCVAKEYQKEFKTFKSYAIN